MKTDTSMISTKQTLQSEEDKKQSIWVNAMRFLLITMVVTTHVYPNIPVKVVTLFDGNHIYDFFGTAISQSFGLTAVGCFFVFSGYYLARGTSSWSYSLYRTQLSKRVRTLLIPYILWNVLYMVIIVCKSFFFQLLGLPESSSTQEVWQYSLFQILWVFPLNLPLWYVRDLMCMVIISPAFYYLFRYFKIGGLGILLLLYAGTNWLMPNIPGFSTIALLFFGVGYYLGYNGYNILHLLRHIPFIPLTLLAFLTWITAAYYNDTSYSIICLSIYNPFGVLFTFKVGNMLFNRYPSIQSLSLRYAPTVFFILAIHTIYIYYWMKGLVSRFSLSAPLQFFSYALITIATLIVCIWLYKIWQKLSPSTLSVMVGGRKPIKIQSDESATRTP